METIEMTVLELYITRNHLAGVEGLKGFVNEDGLSEGIKRRATKALRIIFQECEPINKRLDELRVIIKSGGAEEAEEAKAKEQELLKDLVKINIEKMDFKRIEDVSLSCDYQFLYDKIFINS